MVELFRFIEQAYPTRRPDNAVIEVGGDGTDFQTELEQARGGPDPRADMPAAADRFIESQSFLADSSQLQRGDQYEQFARLAHEPPPADGEEPSLGDLASQVFDDSADRLVQRQDFRNDKARVNDALLAVKFASDAGAAPIARYTLARKGMGLIEKMAAGPLDRRAGRQLISRPLRVPESLLPPRPVPAADDSTGGNDEEDARRKELEKQLGDALALEQAYKALMALSHNDMEVTPGSSSPLLRSRAPRSERSGDRATLGPKVEPSAGEAVVRATPAAVARLGTDVRATLARHNVDLAQASLPSAVAELRLQMTSVMEGIRPELTPARTRVYQLGGNMIEVTSLPQQALAASNLPADFSKAKIKPMMVGNLQLVRQQLIGYEANEISFIENVLEGEVYARETERQQLTESTTLIETETTKGEERDLQSTERNELRTEAQRESGVSSSSSSGGVSSQSYGKLVENSQSNYGKEVTDRATNRVTERVREQRTQRRLESFLEKTRHEFSNLESGKNIRGIYQWVDKKFRARIFNYGKRLLYDVVVPEPAAFFIDSLQKAQQPESFSLQKPAPPMKLKPGGISMMVTGSGIAMSAQPLQPEDVNASNYLGYATQYGVTGSVQPPPDEFKTIAWLASQTAGLTFRAEKIALPPGYAAVGGFFQSTNWLDDQGNYFNGTGEVHVGYSHHFAMTTLGEVFKMNGEMGDVPITFVAGGVKGFNVAVGITCKNETAYRQWQIKTFSSIVDGYKRQLAVYEERLATLQALVRTQMLLARNYSHNPSTERTELKKAFIHLLMSEHFATAYVATPDPMALPKDVDYAKAWAASVAFFERAFEWENMMYVFYPYFWGRKQKWAELILIQDIDPDFESFLKAGGARVVVPARPGFEGALAHYHETGSLWFGKDMVDVFSDANLSIIDEIKARNAEPGTEKCVQEWDVTLPTTLVMLRDTADLPTWPDTIDCGADEEP